MNKFNELVGDQSYPKLESVTRENLDGIGGLKYNKILEPHFITTVVGKPGSGKSYLLEELLINDDLYFEKFDYVYIVSPSRFTSLTIDNNAYSSEYDLLWIASKIEEASQQIKEENKPDERYNVLFVFDDVIAKIKHHEREEFEMNLFFNRRNIIPETTISIILTTQKFNLLPAKLRSVLTSMYIFNLSQTDFKLACNDMPFIDKNEFKLICDKAFREEHGFVFVKLKPFLVCINFQPEFLKEDLKNFVDRIEDRSVLTNNDVESVISSQHTITKPLERQQKEALKEYTEVKKVEAVNEELYESTDQDSLEDSAGVEMDEMENEEEESEQCIKEALPPEPQETIRPRAQVPIAYLPGEPKGIESSAASIKQYLKQHLGSAREY